MKNNIIYRFPVTGEREYLRVNTKTTRTVIDGKKFPEHGHLVDKEMAGNGYHGRCSNCGLALVTDLGYSSWSDTKCEIKKEVKEKVDTKSSWIKNANRATRLTEEDSNKHFSRLIHAQGWGKYNFQVKKV